MSQTLAVSAIHRGINEISNVRILSYTLETTARTERIYGYKCHANINIIIRYNSCPIKFIETHTLRLSNKIQLSKARERERERESRCGKQNKRRRSIRVVVPF